MQTNKIVVFATIAVHMKSKGVQCIPKNSLFGVNFGLAAATFHISLRTFLARTSLSRTNTVVDGYPLNLTESGWSDHQRYHTADDKFDILHEWWSSHVHLMWTGHWDHAGDFLMLQMYVNKQLKPVKSMTLIKFRLVYVPDSWKIAHIMTSIALSDK